MNKLRTLNIEQSKKANGYSNSVIERLRMQKESQVLCDIVLAVEDEKFYLHKCLLNASCDYFDAMSRSGMQETRQEVIKLEDISVRGLKTVIDFIYSGELRLNIDTIEDTLRAISHLQVQYALKLCEEYLCEILNEDNCIYVLNLADLFSIYNLKDYVLKFILKNFVKLIKNENFKKLSIEQLEYCVQSNRLKVYPEIQVFNLVIDWLNVDPSERSGHLASLMRHVRFHTMKPEEFVDIVSKCEWIKANAACNKFLIEAYEYFALPNRQYSSSCSRSQIRNEPCIVCVNESMYVLNKREESWQYLCHSIATSKTLSQKFIVVNNFLYACGGYSELNRETTNKCNRFDPRTGQWQQISSMNEKRQFFTLAANNDYIVSVGGVYGDRGNFYATFPVKSPIEIYSIESNQWITVRNPKIPILKWPGACILNDNKVFIVGGKITDTQANNLSQQSYLVKLNSNDNDVQLCSPPLTVRFNPSLFFLNDDKIVLFGGEDDKYRMAPCIELFNLTVQQWTEIATIPVSLSYQCISSTSLINQKKIFYLLEEHGPSSESYILKASYFDLNTFKFEKSIQLPHPSTLASKWCTLVFPQDYLEKCQNSCAAQEAHSASVDDSSVGSTGDADFIRMNINTNRLNLLTSGSDTESEDSDEY